MRTVAVCVFSDEKTAFPKSTGSVPWRKVVEEHKKRRLRPGKSGVMLGGYMIAGTRANDHVMCRSLIQLDIDTRGVKDKATGRIVHVTNPAPPLDQVRPGIDGYEWCAASSHWHEPTRGVIKYRVVILPDRDIQREEWEPVLEALDERLSGSLDRGAWQWSQAFYLPSCPPESEADAFFEHNEGEPLPVDEFVRRGREILAEKRGALAQLPMPAHATGAGGNILPPDPPSAETMRAALQHLTARGCFSEYSGVSRDAEGRIDKVGWIAAGMALKAAYGDADGYDHWAETHEDDCAAGAAGEKWRSFALMARPGDIGVGTLIKAAKDAGFTFAPPALPDSGGEQITGRGGDVKNGLVFADMFRGKLLHIHETGGWLQFDQGQGWIEAQPGAPDRAAKETLVAMRTFAAKRYQEAPDETNTKHLIAHVERTSKLPNLRAMIEMAKSEPGMTERLADFDTDPWLLGVANGVLNLRTRTLAPTSPDVLVSKRCNVAFDPMATCPRFGQFLEEIQPNKDMADFLLGRMGYCLTGDVSRWQGFAFCYGHGANGKSVFVELMAWLLGDYAHKISTDMLMHHQRNPQSPSPDIVSLKGARFVYANETEEGRRLAEARVKDLTGGDTLTGRVPYGKADITFQPTHKLFIVGNHKPDIGDTSVGMWRRVSLIPFTQTIPEANRDPGLLEALKAEGSGILNALLAGLKRFLSGDLRTPRAVMAATAAYRAEQDVLAEWLDEECETGEGRKVPKSNLYTSYRFWSERNGHRPVSHSKLTRRLNERGFPLAPDKRTVVGLSLKPTTMA